MSKSLKGIETIRRENTLKLMEQHGLSRGDFATQSGISYVQLGHYIGKNPTKNIGNKIAEKIEEFFKKPKNWLDYEHNDEMFSSDDKSFIKDGLNESKKVKVNRIDVKASCGNGYLNLDDPEIIETYEFTESYLRSRGLNTNGEGLVIIDAEGQSMEPTIPDKTPLLINRLENSFNELSTGKVYVFLVNGSVICKRIFINLDGSLTLRSDNPDKTTYPDQIVTKDKFDEFNVIGRLKTALVAF